MNLDSQGLIISGGDGGDTCHRMYTVFLRDSILHSIGKRNLSLIAGVLSPLQTQDLLEPKEDGIYIRHPDPTQWYSNPLTTSRDQLTAPLCYHAHESFHGDINSTEAIKRLFKACLKRGMFAQNIYRNWGEPGKKMPDFMDPGLWGVFIRSSKILSLLLYPALMVCDLFSLIGVAVGIWAPITKDGTLDFRERGMDDVDDDNTNNVMMVAQYTRPTIFSWLARKLYKKYRPVNYGNTRLGEESTILGAMAWYHRPPEGNPEIVELARPIVERY